MIRVTIELLPGGDAAMAETLGVIDIANVTKDVLEVDGLADYHVRLHDLRVATTRTKIIRGFVRERGFWALVRAAVAADDREATG